MEENKFTESEKSKIAYAHLDLMKLYAEQYLEAYNNNFPLKVMNWLGNYYIRFRESASNLGADVSKCPKKLEELIN